ncbi:phosphate uptake regulator PhoU [Deinococcus rubellus]|uniref:Phosphate uptake regulator PhoU n=1 Tax=Deinococcus rubellus TaxID=1889240 RepID=A0ABY5YKI9_9DEIO|nr:phosphate uptake regulator PhoU [Deinococcus rubellus]UWX65221.1 phosphate uptake regulator PhoU [Deinococcus rubellus]
MTTSPHTPTRAQLTARFLRMLSITLEQVSLLQSAVGRGAFAGLAIRTAELERETDVLEDELEELCLSALARPLTDTDLHFYVMVFRSLADLERVGDYGRQVGRDLEALEPLAQTAALQDVLPMARLLSSMLERLAYAFAERDLSGARDVMRLDSEQVDALYEQLQRASLTRILENPEDIGAALTATRMARSLERLGDHVVNVAERLEANMLQAGD